MVAQLALPRFLLLPPHLVPFSFSLLRPLFPENDCRAPAYFSSGSSPRKICRPRPFPNVSGVVSRYLRESPSVRAPLSFRTFVAFVRGPPGKVDLVDSRDNSLAPNSRNREKSMSYAKRARVLTRVRSVADSLRTVDLYDASSVLGKG